MRGKVIWSGRSSPLLFIYVYVGIAVATYLFKLSLDSRLYGHQHFGLYVGLYLGAVLGAGYYYLKARSMRYTMSDSEVHFSESLGDNESITVKLTDIKAIEIWDRQPWSLFRLGTVLLITDFEAETAPCMKCVGDPRALAQRILRAAQAAGSPPFPIEVNP